MGVDVARVKWWSREQRGLVAQLRALARNDFENLWNEEAETAKRRGGFLRFVSQGALERVVRLRRERRAYAARARAGGDEAAPMAWDDVEVDLEGKDWDGGEELDRQVPFGGLGVQVGEEMPELDDTDDAESADGAPQDIPDDTDAADTDEQADGDDASSADSEAASEDSAVKKEDAPGTSTPSSSGISNFHEVFNVGEVRKYTDADGKQRMQCRISVRPGMTSQMRSMISNNSGRMRVFSALCQSNPPPLSSRTSDASPLKVINAPDPDEAAALHRANLAKQPADIPLPPPDAAELLETQREHDKALFRSALHNLHLPPPSTRVFTAAHFFGDSITNIHKHAAALWTPVSDVPLPAQPDPEQDFLPNTTSPRPTAPRWDDWKAYEKHLHRARDHPWTTRAHRPAHDPPPQHAYNTTSQPPPDALPCPPKLSAARIVAPMGEGLRVSPARRVEAAALRLRAGAGVPAGHVGVLMHDGVVAWASDARAEAPGYLADQWSRADGFLAEQAWQWFLVGRLNARNLHLRDGLRWKRECEGLDGGEEAELARLEGDVNAGVERVCVCYGLPTERMVACANAWCHRGPDAVAHARCMDVSAAPGEGERYLCRVCEREVLWFLEEARVAREVEGVLGDGRRKTLGDGRRKTPREVLRPLVMQGLRQLHAKSERAMFETCPIAELVAEFDGKVVEYEEKGEALPAPKELLDKIFLERVERDMQKGCMAPFREFCEVCQAQEIFSRAHVDPDTGGVNIEVLGMPRGVRGEKEKVVEKEQASEDEFEWEIFQPLGEARKLYQPDPIKSAEAVMRWQVQREMEKQ